MKATKIEPNYDAEMKLPEGKTCDDCINSKRCFGFGFSKTGNRSCDFWPNKFRETVPTNVTIWGATMTNGLLIQICLQIAGLGAIASGTAAPLTSYEWTASLRTPLWIFGWALMAFAIGTLVGRMNAEWLNANR